MIMEENKINVPDGSYARIETINGKQVVIIEPEFNPKDGDIIVSGYGKGFYIVEWISIVKDKFNPRDYSYHALYINKGSKMLKYDFGCNAQKYNRYANKEEKQIIFEALNKDGKRWNKYSKKIEEILNVGDICIFWDDDKKYAVVAKLLNINEFSKALKKYGYDKPSSILDEEGGNLCYKNAIKCESLQHYIDFINS